MLLLSQYMTLHIMASIQSRLPAVRNADRNLILHNAKIVCNIKMRSQIYKQVDKMEAEIGKIS
jgi:hypothetical protein